MGAAASVNHIYLAAFEWFKQYFDKDMYIEDFTSMDKDSNGGISMKELSVWIKEKVNKEGNNSPWAHLQSTPEVLTMAHSLSGNRHRDQFSALTDQIVDINGFRSLLINLFAISILYVHFKNADDWVEGQDFGNMTLSFDEFKLACRSITAANCNEDISDEQLHKDFTAIDTDHSGSLAFLEVCDYCTQFLERILVESDAVTELIRTPRKDPNNNNMNSSLSHKASTQLMTNLVIGSAKQQQELDQKQPQLSPRDKGFTLPLNMLKKENSTVSNSAVTSARVNASEKNSSNGINKNTDTNTNSDSTTNANTSNSSTNNSNKTNNGHGPLVQKILVDTSKSDPNANTIAPNADISFQLGEHSAMKAEHRFEPLDSRNAVAVNVLNKTLQANRNVAEFVEVKFNTETEIGNLLMETSRV